MKIKASPLTAKQFDEAVALVPRLSTANKKLARKVLVDGLIANQVATSAQVSRQTLSVVCARILAKFHASTGRPADWVYVELFAPPDLAKAFTTSVAKAIKALPKP